MSSSPIDKAEESREEILTYEIADGDADASAEVDTQSSYSSYESDHEENTSTTAKRRNKNYILIVPRGDIRRMYPQMFVNVINSHYVPTTYSFFVTYCCPELHVKHDFIHCTDGKLDCISSNPTSKTVYFGPLVMVMFFAILVQFCPDQTLQFKDGVIRTSSAKYTTEIECTMQLDFTLLYENNPISVTDDILRHMAATDPLFCQSMNHEVPSPPPEEKRKKCRKKMSYRSAAVEMTSDFHVPNALEYYQQRMGKVLVPVSPPVSVKLSFRLVFIIDSLRRIKMMDFTEFRQ